jgi:hypothetical protein
MSNAANNRQQTPDSQLNSIRPVEKRRLFDILAIIISSRQLDAKA